MRIVPEFRAPHDDGKRRRWPWAVGVAAALLFAFSSCGVSVGLPVIAVMTQCPLFAFQQSKLGHGAGPGLAPDQQQNAAAIVAEVRKEGLPEQAAVDGITAGLAEDNLHNNPVPRDHDSIGVYQQRPSQGWGTPAQIMDVAYATSSFLARLKGMDFLHMDPAQAAQKVQNSGAAWRYTQFVQQAQEIVKSLWSGAPSSGTSKAAAFQCQLGARTTPQGQPEPKDGIAKGLPFPIPPAIPPPGWKLQIPVPQFPDVGIRANPSAVTNQCVAGALWGFATAHLADPKFAHPPAMSVDSAYQMTGLAQQQGWRMDPAPKIGDMAVFKQGQFYGSHGHVALVIGTTQNSYLVAEQNFINSSPSLIKSWGTWDIRSIGWPDSQASGFIAAPPGG